VVFLLALLLNFGICALDDQVKNANSHLQYTTNIIGTLVSGFFLFLIAALNVIILAGIIKVFREMRSGAYDDQQLEEQLNKRGLMNRFLGPLARRIDTPWKMYPIGFLFGLGFDTAGAGRHRRGRRAAVLRGAVAADPVRHRDEPVRHRRRLLHELRLRLGIRPPGPQGLLQPDHRPVHLALRAHRE